MPKKSSADRQPPFTPEQASWVQEGVGAAMGAFGNVIEQKFEQFERDQNAKFQAQADQNAEILKQVKDLQTQVTQLQAASTEKTESHTAIRPPGVPSGFSAPRVSIPFEHRTVATIGNLGWDDNEQTILARAKEVLSKAGVAESDYTGLCATRRKGSTADLCFTSAPLLQQAKMTLRSIKLKYHGDKPVWLDAKKTREELRPARVVHRITELIQEAESGKPDPMHVEKFLNGKYVKVGDERAGFTCRGAWMWTQWARNRYEQEFRDMAKAYAEDE